MTELLQTQLDVAASLRDASQTGCARHWLAGDAASVERRLAIHRTNMVGGGSTRH